METTLPNATMPEVMSYFTDFRIYQVMKNEMLLF